MIPYILHVALLISVCLLFYKIFLQKETFYKLNRLVLLIGLCLSFVLPLISIPQAWTLRNIPKEITSAKQTNAKSVQQAQTTVPLVQVDSKQVAEKAQPEKIKTNNITHENPSMLEKSTWPIVMKWLFYLYWAGVIAFGLNLLLQVIVLLIRAYSNPVIKEDKFRIVEVQGDKAPCSFGNNIFINPEKYDWDTYNQILLHEKVHIKQGHSFDILLAELVLVFQWFNPFAWLYRGELENNLEFLTDEAVLDQNEVEKSSYQMSLLKVSAPHLALSVTTNYNQSLLKKRIVMMNAKRSNIHTMWKYFMLIPVMGGLACALNETAFSQTTNNSTHAKTTVKSHQSHQNWGNTDRTSGSWFATIKGERVRIEFRSDEDDKDWNSSSDNFKLSELSAIPRDKKGDFIITRDAGTMKFNGMFDGNQGYGHYKFEANKEFEAYVGNHGVTDMDYQDQFAFFILNITRDYVAMLRRNGFGNISKNDIISMAALKVDEQFIKYWKENGYPDIAPNELVSAKALGVDGKYVDEIHNAGYPHISYNQLISFKAQGITGAYIRGLRKRGKAGETNLPSPDDIPSYKALNVDSAYLSGLKVAGYDNIPSNEVTAMKSMNITPEYAKGFSQIGYKDLSVNELVSFKSLNITPEFIKSFKDIGYDDISASELMTLKSLGITADYAKGFEALGFRAIPVNDLTSFKSLGITSVYVKSFQDIGYRDISPNDLASLKSLGVTAGFVKGFKDLGFNNISLNEATSLKATGVTPEYVSQMKAKGFNSKDLDKYIQLKNAFN